MLKKPHNLFLIVVFADDDDATPFRSYGNIHTYARRLSRPRPSLEVETVTVTTSHTTTHSLKPSLTFIGLSILDCFKPSHNWRKPRKEWRHRRRSWRHSSHHNSMAHSCCEEGASRHEARPGSSAKEHFWHTPATRQHWRGRRRRRWRWGEEWQLEQEQERVESDEESKQDDEDWR